MPGLSEIQSGHFAILIVDLAGAEGVVCRVYDNLDSGVLEALLLEFLGQLCHVRIQSRSEEHTSELQSLV